MEVSPLGFYRSFSHGDTEDTENTKHREDLALVFGVCVLGVLGVSVAKLQNYYGHSSGPVKD
jgi:hypothetical protein